jgi:hypothetical protein
MSSVSTRYRELLSQLLAVIHNYIYFGGKCGARFILLGCLKIVTPVSNVVYVCIFYVRMVP